MSSEMKVLGDAWSFKKSSFRRGVAKPPLTQALPLQPLMRGARAGGCEMLANDDLGYLMSSSIAATLARSTYAAISSFSIVVDKGSPADQVAHSAWEFPQLFAAISKSKNPEPFRQVFNQDDMRKTSLLECAKYEFGRSNRLYSQTPIAITKNTISGR